MCWVRPGVLDAKASWRCWARVLTAVDLPALDRPTKATSGSSEAGSWSSFAAVVKKRAEWVHARASRASGDHSAASALRGAWRARPGDGVTGRGGFTLDFDRLGLGWLMGHCKIPGFI